MTRSPAPTPVWLARSSKHPRRAVECDNRYEALGAATGLLDKDGGDAIEIVDPDGEVTDTVMRGRFA